jgi:WD40 repeat protein
MRKAFISVLFLSLMIGGFVEAGGPTFFRDVLINSSLKVGGTGLAASTAAIELNSTTKGLLLPRMTTTQMNAISSPPEGLKVYNTTTHNTWVYNGTAWVAEINAASTTGDIYYSSATNTISRLAAGSSGNVLTMGASVPAWSSVGITSIADGTLTVAKQQDLIEFVETDTGDFSDKVGIKGIAQYPWSAPVKMTNPASLPGATTSAAGISWSPNGEFVTVGIDASPYIQIYQRNNTELVKLPNPASLPASVADSGFPSWSPDGQFLAVPHQTTPYITIYQKAFGTKTFTKLSNPATLPGATGFGTCWSPNGEFLAVGSTSTPYITIYQRSGTTFTKIANPATLPGSLVINCKFSPDGQFLAMTGTMSPPIMIYQRTADTTFTQLTLTGTAPSGSVYDIDWSPDMKYVTAAGGSVGIYEYLRSGTTFTLQTAPATTPSGGAYGIRYSPNGQQLAVCMNNTPYVLVYSVAAGVLTANTAPATTPTGICQGIGWSPDGQFLTVAHYTTPFITNYQTASDMPATGLMFMRKRIRAGQ